MITFILNDAPYGDERPYNAFRLASALAKKDEEVQVFFFADAVFCGKKNQQTPDGYYNIERMIKGLLRKGGKVYAWGSCSDARGVSQDQVIDGIQLDCLDTLAEWVASSDKTLVF